MSRDPADHRATLAATRYRLACHQATYHGDHADRGVHAPLAARWEAERSIAREDLREALTVACAPVEGTGWLIRLDGDGKVVSLRTDVKLPKLTVAAKG